MAEDNFFFSYSRFDSEFVLKLAKNLREAGAKVWLDQVDIPFGSRWDKEIEKALNNATCLLAIVSEKSIDSVNFMDEVSYALEENKRVIPLFLDIIKDPPFRLRRLQHIDFANGYKKGFLQLTNALNLKADGIELPGDDAGTASRSEKGSGTNSSEEALWQKAEMANDKDLYQTYLAKYPEGRYKKDAREAITSLEKLVQLKERKQKEKELWEQSSKIDTILSYQNYLGKTELGEHIDKANNFIKIKIRESQGPKVKTNSNSRVFLIIGVCLVILFFGLRGILKNDPKADTTTLDTGSAKKEVSGTEVNENLPKTNDDQKVSGNEKKENATSQNTDAVEQQAWDAAVNEKTLKAYKDYQKNYPDGKHFNEARTMINSLQADLERMPGLYPQSSERILTGDDLRGLSKWDLQVMRNEIFARHNFIFKTNAMKAYFAQQPWYKGIYDNVNDQLSNIELVNIAFIKTYE